MLFGQQLNTQRIFKRQVKALIRLRVRAGWSEPLLVAHTTLLEISCRGSFINASILTYSILSREYRDPRQCFFCGSFLLVTLHIGVCCAVVSVPGSLLVTCWERAYLFAVVCVCYVFLCCVTFLNVRIKGEVGAVKLG